VDAFTRVERTSLRDLRNRYRIARDILGAREMARLRFVRWLYHEGRVAP
jgi:hypothetical protein